MHVVYPTGRPAFDIARLFDEPERKTFEERQKEKKKNQEKELRRLAHLLENAQGLRAGAGGAAGRGRTADLPLEALAPVARGEVPVVIRADAEDDIRGAVAFARERGLKLIVAGGARGLALRGRCSRQQDVAVLLNVDRLPRREADPYDAAYTNAAALHARGRALRHRHRRRLASRGTCPTRRRWRARIGLPADAALRAITLVAGGDLRRGGPDGLARGRQGGERGAGHAATSWTTAPP